MMEPFAFVFRSVEARLAEVRASEVEVAFVVVEFNAVKFWRVLEPVLNRFESVARPPEKLPKLAVVAKRLVVDAVVAKKLVEVAFVVVLRRRFGRSVSVPRVVVALMR